MARGLDSLVTSVSKYGISVSILLLHIYKALRTETKKHVFEHNVIEPIINILTKVFIITPSAKLNMHSMSEKNS